jgi:hypothetical protein
VWVSLTAFQPPSTLRRAVRNAAARGASDDVHHGRAGRPDASERPRPGASGAVTERVRRSIAIAVLAALVSAGHTAYGNGVRGQLGADDPPTRFERFLLHDCSPCVREAHAVGVMAAPSLRLGGLARMTGQATRPGEISVDVVRAYPLGRPSRQRLALRVTLSVVTGGAGDVYKMGTALVDDEDLPALADAIAEIGKALPALLAAGDESAEAGFHAGSLRVGVARLRGESAAYLQSGDVATLALRPVWEAPSTVYLAVAQWPALGSLVAQAAARAQKLRSGP